MSGQVRLRPRVLTPCSINNLSVPESRPIMQKGPVSRPSRRRRRKRRSLGTMPNLQDYTVYTPDNQIADLAEHQA